MTKTPIRVLVIDDNEEDFIILKAVLSKEPFQSYLLENVSDLKSALKRLELKRHDVFLVDYRLGPDSGLEFLKKALEANCKVPVILLTGQGDHELDLWKRWLWERRILSARTCLKMASWRGPSVCRREVQIPGRFEKQRGVFQGGHRKCIGWYCHYWRGRGNPLFKPLSQKHSWLFGG